jgi:membrane fusion protein (multidrug efflux system)
MKIARITHYNNNIGTVKYQLLIIVPFVLFGACSQGEKEKSTENKKGADTLKVFSLKGEKLEKHIGLPGELLSYERVEVRPKVAGYIRQLRVDIGMQVKKGQVLMLVDAPEIQARLGEGTGNMNSAKAKYQISLDTYTRIAEASRSKGVISANELQKAKNQMLADSAEYESQKFAYESYKQIGNYLAITAPFNGVISQRNINEGSYVGGANEKPLLVIEDNSKLRLRVAVSEALSGVELKDNKVKFTTKVYPNKSFDAMLVRKSGSIDVNTRTETWEFEVQNSDNVLKAGSFASVNLNISRNAASFFVPFSSVVTTLEKKFVIRVSHDSTEWIDIIPGLNLSDKTEIFGSLTEGDTLVNRANEEIRPKEKVYVRF